MADPDRNPPSTQLNSESGGSGEAGTTAGPTGTGSGTGDLKHSKAAMKSAVEYIRETQGPETRKAGVGADTDSTAIIGDNPLSSGDTSAPRTDRGGTMRGWQIQWGLRERHQEWQRHLRQLERRLQREQDGLRGTNQLFASNEQQILCMFNPTRSDDGSRSPQIRSPISDFVNDSNSTASPTNPARSRLDDY